MKKQNKQAMKTYFIISNLVVSIIAISFLIGSIDAIEYPDLGNVGSTNVPAQSSGGLVGFTKGYFGDFAKGASDILFGNEVPAPPQQAASAVGGLRVSEPAAGFLGGRVEINSQVLPGSSVPSYPSLSTLNPTGTSKLTTTGTAAATGTTAPSAMGGVGTYFGSLPYYLGQIAVGAGIGALIGQFAGGKDGAMWGAISGASGMFVYQMAMLYQISTPFTSVALTSGLLGIGVAVVIFLLTYKKEKTQIVEFNCLPWQAPIGGANCEKCNSYKDCSEYSCKSLGQACELVNVGTSQQKCIWKNPQDTQSPTIQMKSVSKGYKYYPDTSIRPPATGVEISQESGACVKAFTALEFTFITNEPSQCKVDYNLTSDAKTAFDEMGYYVGGDSSFDYNHTEKLSLPGPDTINKIAPELKNDGVYNLYLRCQDANGNFNVNPFSVKFCVEKGPDTTAPIITNVNIPSGSPIQFNKTSLDIEVYVNEPSECKWSHDNRDYNNMEETMDCNNDLWEMNSEETYTCKAHLTGIKDREENLFYFRCKDQPWAEEKDRNVNSASYVYKIIGTQPLNILEVEPNGTIYGSTESIAVNLKIRTDNGYKNGEARCYYSLNNTESSYIEFLETGTNVHTQRQDLVTGDYQYYFKCVDLGGNAAYNSTRFRIESDRTSPVVVRAYKESGELKIVTNEKAECSYSNINCNFEIDDGINMLSLDYYSHNSEWSQSKNYYIRCKDNYNNQPNPNTCSIILRPSDLGVETEDVIEL